MSHQIKTETKEEIAIGPLTDLKESKNTQTSTINKKILNSIKKTFDFKTV